MPTPPVQLAAKVTTIGVVAEEALRMYPPLLLRPVLLDQPVVPTAGIYVPPWFTEFIVQGFPPAVMPDAKKISA